MIFKSRQVNLDPLAEMCHCGTDVADHSPLDNHSPVGVQRPEFEPTRDPKPWKNVYNGRRLPNTESLARLWRNGKGNRTHWVWAPRREQFDTPLNRVLVDMRGYRSERLTMKNPKGWARVLSAFEVAAQDNPWQATPDEIDHARRVLVRLANWKEQ